MDKDKNYTPNPWELTQDPQVTSAALDFIRRYEIQKVNSDVRMSGKDWLEEGFKAGVEWARHVDKTRST